MIKNNEKYLLRNEKCFQLPNVHDTDVCEYQCASDSGSWGMFYLNSVIFICLDMDVRFP